MERAPRIGQIKRLPIDRGRATVVGWAPDTLELMAGSERSGRSAAPNRMIARRSRCSCPPSPHPRKDPNAETRATREGANHTATLTTANGGKATQINAGHVHGHVDPGAEVVAHRFEHLSA